MKTILAIASGALLLALAFGARADDDSLGTPNIGERLFLETRFAEFFFTNSGGNANFQLTNGDPVMDTSESIYGSLAGPFAGESMNCRACHMVEEHENVGNRTYADFAPRSPIPFIGDGRVETPRNAMVLVDSLLPHNSPLFLHFDGQFATPQDLIIGTLTGRNYGWKPTEYATALAHIVHIIRSDDGSGGLAQQYGGNSYAQAFAATGAQTQYRILTSYRLSDVSVTNMAATNYVSDDAIIADVAALIEAYLETLVFSQDSTGQFNGSPYDVFLLKNELPRSPDSNETPLQYTRRLLQLINDLPAPQFVTDPDDGHFATHNQAFQFGPTELAGLKIFFAQGGKAGATGNCVACHTPPAFTDFLFHNTGTEQEEYDAMHGTGAFLTLFIPALAERETNHDAYLPPTPAHPNATGMFITPPTVAQPGQVDLGLWNVFANPDFPGPQPGLQQIAPLLMGLPPAPPQITRSTVVGHDFVLGGSGPPGWMYQVLTATNLALAAGSWTVLSTNTFDPGGGFAFTNTQFAAQQFFMISVTGPSPALALPRVVALFKTPNVRDLGSSEPYFHTGRMDTLEDVIAFYQNFSILARAGAVRNPAPELSGVSLDSSAVTPLAAFLRALNEDYFDIPCPCQL